MHIRYSIHFGPLTGHSTGLCDLILMKKFLGSLFQRESQTIEIAVIVLAKL